VNGLAELTFLAAEAHRQAWGKRLTDQDFFVLTDRLTQARKWFTTLDDQRFTTLVLKAIVGRRYDPFYCALDSTDAIVWGDRFDTLLRDVARIVDGAYCYDVAQQDQKDPYSINRTGRHVKIAVSGSQIRRLESPVLLVAAGSVATVGLLDRRPKRTY
jgi:hypothetical protein